MSNDTELAMWALAKGTACPSVKAVEDALAANGSNYAKAGDVLFSDPTLGTVTLVDDVNGLVHISAADAKMPGQLFCCAPTAKALDPKGRAASTIEYNTAFAAGSDRGLGLWVRVMPVTQQDSASRPFVPDMKAGWIPNAWSIGNEFSDWPSVIDRAANHCSLPT